MKVTLKKAAELAREAVEKANKTSVATKLDISIYGKTPVADAIARAKVVMTDSIANTRDLIEAAFVIRDAIGQQNAALGVNSLMTKRSQADAVEKKLTSIVGDSTDRYSEVVDIDTVESKLAALATRQDAYGREDVSVRLLDGDVAAALDEQLAAIRLQKAEYRDALAAINLTNHVTLDERTVEVLRRNKLIA